MNMHSIHYFQLLRIATPWMHLSTCKNTHRLKQQVFRGPDHHRSIIFRPLNARKLNCCAGSTATSIALFWLLFSNNNMGLAVEAGVSWIECLTSNGTTGAHAKDSLVGGTVLSDITWFAVAVTARDALVMETWDSGAGFF